MKLASRLSVKITDIRIELRAPRIPATRVEGFSVGPTYAPPYTSGQKFCPLDLVPYCALDRPLARPRAVELMQGR